MSNKEVIQIGGKPVGDMKQQVNRAKVVLEALMQQRKGGLTQLETRVNNLLDSDKMTADQMPVACVSVLRDLSHGLNAALLSLSAQDKYIDMIVNDLSKALQQLDNQQDVWWMVSSHLQTLLSLLAKKNVISEQEMKDAWDQIVKDAKAEEAKNATPEVSA